MYRKNVVISTRPAFIHNNCGYIDTVLQIVH